MSIHNILIAIGSWAEKQVKPSSTSIGDTLVINGIEYWNMGDENDQDNWLYVGPAFPSYFINVLIENSQVFYTLSTMKNEEAVYFEGFYELEEAEKKLKFHGYEYRLESPL